MKKALSLVLAVVMIAMTFLLSGCIRYHGTISFNEDGTIDTTMLLALHKESAVDPSTGEAFTIFDEESIEAYKELGFTFEEYSEDGFEGHTLSLTENVNESLEELSGVNAIASIAETPLFYVEEDKVIMCCPYPEKSEEEIEAGKEMLGSVGGYNLLTIEFPFAPIESNATSVSEDGKSLTWDYYETNGKFYAVYSLEDFEKKGMTTEYMSHNPFDDVKYEDYYHDAVMWALDNGVTTGTSETKFSPSATCTRGQVVTFLWRAFGEPEPSIKINPFDDVKESDYYYKAVLWAIENGITSGTGEKTFSPDSTCSYAHILTFIWRAYGEPVMFSLQTEDDEWYSAAFAWAEISGLLDGLPTEEPDPAANCPRADVVTLLYRALGYTATDMFANYTDMITGMLGTEEYYDTDVSIDLLEEVEGLDEIEE